MGVAYSLSFVHLLKQCIRIGNLNLYPIVIDLDSNYLHLCSYTFLRMTWSTGIKMEDIFGPPCYPHFFWNQGPCIKYFLCSILLCSNDEICLITWSYTLESKFHWRSLNLLRVLILVPADTCKLHTRFLKLVPSCCPSPGLANIFYVQLHYALMWQDEVGTIREVGGRPGWYSNTSLQSQVCNLQVVGLGWELKASLGSWVCKLPNSMAKQLCAYLLSLMSTSFGLAATTTNDDVIFDVKDDEGIAWR